VQGLCPKTQNFWQSEHQCFQKNQRSRSCATKPTVKICVKLPVSTYLPTNPTKFLIFNYLIIYFSLSLSSSPHEIFVNESNGQDLSAAPATYQLSRSLSLSLGLQRQIQRSRSVQLPLPPPTHFPLSNYPPWRSFGSRIQRSRSVQSPATTNDVPLSDSPLEDPTVKICAECCHHQPTNPFPTRSRSPDL